MFEHIRQHLWRKLQCNICNQPTELPFLLAELQQQQFICWSCHLKSQGNNTESNNLTNPAPTYLPTLLNSLLYLSDTPSRKIPTTIHHLCEQLRDTCIKTFNEAIHKLEKYVARIEEMCLGAQVRARRYQEQILQNVEITEHLKNQDLTVRQIKGYMKKKPINERKYVEFMHGMCEEMEGLIEKMKNFQLRFPETADPPTQTISTAFDSRVLSVACNKSHLVSSSADGNLSCWHHNKLSTLKVRDGLLPCVSFFRNMVVSVSDDSVFKFWNFNDVSGEFTLVKQFGGSPEGRKTTVRNLVCFEKAGWLMTCTGKNDGFRIRGWSYETEQVMLELEGHTDYIKGLVQVQDTQFLISASADCTVRIWDLLTSQCKTTIFTHKKILSLLYSSRLNLIILLQDDCFISVYPFTLTQKPRKLFSFRPARSISCVCLADDLLCVITSHEITLWTVTGQLKHTIKRTDKLIINTVCCEGNRLFAGDGTGKVMVVPYKERRCLV